MSGRPLPSEVVRLLTPKAGQSVGLAASVASVASVASIASGASHAGGRFDGSAQAGTNARDASGLSIVSTGVLDLDSALPQGGFPRGAVTELASPLGIGVATSVALAACATAQAEARQRGEASAWCAFLDPTHSLHGPGVAAWAIDLSRLLVVRPALEALARAAVRMVQSRAFAVVVIDTAGVPGASGSPSLAAWATAARRIALAAEGSETAVLLLTDRDAVRPQPLPVAMRVELHQPSPGRLAVRVAKERRGQVAGWKHVAWAGGLAGEDEDV
jgi:hypothetical protein